MSLKQIRYFEYACESAAAKRINEQTVAVGRIHASQEDRKNIDRNLEQMSSALLVKLLKDKG